MIGVNPSTNKIYVPNPYNVDVTVFDGATNTGHIRDGRQAHRSPTEPGFDEKQRNRHCNRTASSPIGASQLATLRVLLSVTWPLFASKCRFCVHQTRKENSELANICLRKYRRVRVVSEERPVLILAGL
jgi:hypothetical protein